MSTRSDAALSLTGGILGGLAIGTWLARRYLKTSVPTKPYSQAGTSLGNLKGAKP